MRERDSWRGYDLPQLPERRAYDAAVNEAVAGFWARTDLFPSRGAGVQGVSLGRSSRFLWRIRQGDLHPRQAIFQRLEREPLDFGPMFRVELLSRLAEVPEEHVK